MATGWRLRTGGKKKKKNGAGRERRSRARVNHTRSFGPHQLESEKLQLLVFLGGFFWYLSGSLLSLRVCVCVCVSTRSPLAGIQLVADWSYSMSEHDCSKLEKREHFHWWGEGHLPLRIKPLDAAASENGITGVSTTWTHRPTHTHTHTHSRTLFLSLPLSLSLSPALLSPIVPLTLFFSPSSVCLLCSTSQGSPSALISQATAPRLLLIWSE